MADYKPKGTIETLHTLPTYIARPTSQPKGIIIIIPDAFGLPFPNNKHLADTYATHGYLAYLPDVMKGRHAPHWMVYQFPKVLATKTWWDIIKKPYDVAWAIYGFVPFLIQNRWGQAMPIVKSYFEAVREANPSLPIAASGFCWGGRHAIVLANGLRTPSGKLYSDANFAAHPSNVVMPDDFKGVTMPLSIAEGTEDFVFSLKEAQEAEAILREKKDKGVVKFAEVVYYEKAGHGFAVRADPDTKEAVEKAAQSVLQAVNFFDKVFAEWKPS